MCNICNDIVLVQMTRLSNDFVLTWFQCSCVEVKVDAIIELPVRV